MRRYLALFASLLTLVSSSAALAWNDLTHMAVMKAAGLGDYAYMAVGADMAKEKALGHEDGNHYCNKSKGTVVTPDMVLDQVGDYNCRCPGEGHLYGAIVAALNQYIDNKRRGKFALYDLGFAAHYLGDLSMPLHNIEYDDFNKAHHLENDGVVEKEEVGPADRKVADIARKIQQRMKALPAYRLPAAGQDPRRFKYELARRIADLANKASALGYSMRDATPQRELMTSEEAYRQLAQSALLLQSAYAALQ